ncbi:LOW QUALITY PROTEIN: hypothetical protein HID58_088399 [Brassica napus]|uniref:Transmembrane protein n=1 Tax=Brassica napus TaxID=3708 RepID=A0ABQ7XW25_BRANA|nr:LOW QUALITY PROTEIN: hypothetical protein HID58_088399 [Brassica napus]
MSIFQVLLIRILDVGEERSFKGEAQIPNIIANFADKTKVTNCGGIRWLLRRLGSNIRDFIRLEQNVLLYFLIVIFHPNSSSPSSSSYESFAIKNHRHYLISFAPVRLRFVSSKTLRIHQFIAIKKQFTTHNYHNQTFNVYPPIKRSDLISQTSSSQFIKKKTRILFSCLMAYSSIFRLAAILSLSLMGFCFSQDRCSIGYLGRPLNIETTFRVSTGCAHGFGFFFFAGPSVTVIAILLIHITDVKTIVLLAKKSGGDHGGRGGGRGGGGHEDHVGMEKKKNARHRKDVEWFVDQACVIQVSWNLGDIRSWSCAQIPVSKNRVAMEIAGSVTREHRFQSYIARFGPSWLQQHLLTEALD